MSRYPAITKMLTWSFLFCTGFPAPIPDTDLWHKLYFPHLASGADQIFTQIVLVNLNNDASVRLQISLRDDIGEPLSVVLDGKHVQGDLRAEIPPAGFRIFRSGTGGELQVGSAAISSSQPLAGVLLFGGEMGLAGVGSSPSLLNGFVIPVKVNSAEGLSTGVALMNLENEEVYLHLELVDNDGSLKATAIPEQILASRGHLARYVHEFTWDRQVDLSKFEGSLRVHTSGRVGATALITYPNEFATLPVTPLGGHFSQQDHVLQFAHIATGGGSIFSEIILLNLDEELRSEGTMFIRGDSGQALNLSFGGEESRGLLDLQLKQGGSRFYRGELDGELETGSVSVSSTTPMAGVIIFGGSVGVAGVGSGRPHLSGLITPVESNAQQEIKTGIAVMNPNGSAVSMSLELSSPEGRILARSVGPIHLASNGHLARFVNEFSWDTEIDFAQFDGLLKVRTSNAISATALQTRPGQLSTLPVIGLPQELVGVFPMSVPPGGEFKVEASGLPESSDSLVVPAVDVLIRTELGHEISMPAVSTSSQGVTAFLPPINLGGTGEWYQGPAEVCLERSGQLACLAQQINIEPPARSETPVGHVLIAEVERAVDRNLQHLQEISDERLARAIEDLTLVNLEALRNQVQHAVDGRPHDVELELSDGRRITYKFDVMLIEALESLLVAGQPSGQSSGPVGSRSLTSEPLTYCGSSEEHLKESRKAMLDRALAAQDGSFGTSVIFAMSALTSCGAVPAACPAIGGALVMLNNVLLVASLPAVIRELELKYLEANTLHEVSIHPSGPFEIAAGEAFPFQIIGEFGTYEGLGFGAEAMRRVISYWLFRNLGQRLWGGIPNSIMEIILSTLVGALERELGRSGFPLNRSAPTAEIELGNYSVTAMPFENQFARVTLACPPGMLGPSHMIGVAPSDGQTSFFEFWADRADFIKASPHPFITDVGVVVRECSGGGNILGVWDLDLEASPPVCTEIEDEFLGRTVYILEQVLDIGPATFIATTRADVGGTVMAVFNYEVQSCTLRTYNGEVYVDGNLVDDDPVEESYAFSVEDEGQTLTLSPGCIYRKRE